MVGVSLLYSSIVPHYSYSAPNSEWKLQFGMKRNNFVYKTKFHSAVQWSDRGHRRVLSKFKPTKLCKQDTEQLVYKYIHVKSLFVQCSMWWKIIGVIINLNIFMTWHPELISACRPSDLSLQSIMPPLMPSLVMDIIMSWCICLSGIKIIQNLILQLILGYKFINYLCPLKSSDDVM